jgi:hypothetical protein
VKDLRKMNISLLCKWWWKVENEEGLWQEIVCKKYKVQGGSNKIKYSPLNPPVWNDLIKIKELYLARRKIIIGNGRDTDFWRDPWCGDYSLKNKFGELFDICNEQSVTVAYMASRRWRLTFRRWLDENAQSQLRLLKDRILVCPLETQKDRPIWVWEKNKIYFVKSMYKHLCRADVGEPNQNIWKAKIP